MAPRVEAARRIWRFPPIPCKEQVKNKYSGRGGAALHPHLQERCFSLVLFHTGEGASIPDIRFVHWISTSYQRVRRRRTIKYHRGERSSVDGGADARKTASRALTSVTAQLNPSLRAVRHCICCFHAFLRPRNADSRVGTMNTVVFRRCLFKTQTPVSSASRWRRTLASFKTQRAVLVLDREKACSFRPR
jgi:hypothetical protein